MPHIVGWRRLDNTREPICWLKSLRDIRQRKCLRNNPIGWRRLETFGARPLSLFGAPADIIGHTSEVLGHKLLTLDPRSRVVRIRFPGGVGAPKFPPTQVADSRFPETP